MNIKHPFNRMVEFKYNMVEFKDKYDRAIDHLMQNKKEIYFAWGNPEGYTSGCLFQFVTKTGKIDPRRTGCLTQIRSGSCTGPTSKLTNMIRDDARIPNHVPNEKTTRKQLEAMAEWQRKLDSTIRAI